MRGTHRPVRPELRWRPPVIDEQWKYYRWRNDLGSIRAHHRLWRSVDSLVRLLWAHSTKESGVSAVLARCPPQWSRWWVERVPYFQDYARGAYEAFFEVEIPASGQLDCSDPGFVHPTRHRARSMIEFVYDARPTTPEGVAERLAHAKACRVRDTPSCSRELQWR